jgi:hypothetical protein
VLLLESIAPVAMAGARRRAASSTSSQAIGLAAG